MKTKGRLIVIDGTDGSGKATQTELLVKSLRKVGYKVKVENFPQYGRKSAGAVEDYLNGVYGTARELGPYIPSTFYAIDRFAASGRIRDNLKKGYIVVSNRYVSANLAHQGGKISNKIKRGKYFKWLFGLEYGLYRIPKPDLNLILHMPAEAAQKLIDHRLDLHEADLKHLRDAEKVYVEMAKSFRYPIIECYKSGIILTRDEIADQVWKKVKSSLKNKPH